MNIAVLQTYFKAQNSEYLNNAIDFQLISFEHSKDDGIFLDLKNGKYTCSVGKLVSKDQANRVLAVIYMDITLGVKNEADRIEKGYSEFATSVAKQKYKFFKPEYVWIDMDGKLVKDQIVEEFKTNCLTKKCGKVEKTKIYGMYPKEIRFIPKDEKDSRHDSEEEEL